MKVRGVFKVIGASSGEGQRGIWYNVSIVDNDGEALRLNCNKGVFDAAKNLPFGSEITFVIDARLYGRDWGVRAIDLEEV